MLFFRATTHFTRQVAHFTRSWSSGKMLAFQPRGFVFEPVGMRLFFYKYSEAEGSHFFWVLWDFSALWDFFRIFLNVPKESSFQFFLIFCKWSNVKNPKGSRFSEFSELWDFKILFFFENFLSKESTFNFFWNSATEWILKNLKGSPLSQFPALWHFSKGIIFVLKLGFLRSGRYIRFLLF